MDLLFFREKIVFAYPSGPSDFDENELDLQPLVLWRAAGALVYKHHQFRRNAQLSFCSVVSWSLQAVTARSSKASLDREGVFSLTAAQVACSRSMLPSYFHIHNLWSLSFLSFLVIIISDMH